MEWIALRNFSRQAGMVYEKDILKNIPEPYLTDYLALGLITEYDATGTPEIPHYVSTGTGMKRIEVKEEEPKKEIKTTGGKPGRKTVKK